MMDTLRVLLPAGQVPCGSVITKRTGTKEYTIRDSIRIHHKGWVQVIRSVGLRYLIAKGSDINVVDKATPLLAELTLDQIKEVMGEGQIQSPPIRGM